MYCVRVVGAVGRFALLAVMVGVWVGLKPATALAAPVTYYPQTGHTLELGFAGFVAAHGGVEVMGLPITEEIEEGGRTVQYFQHVRLEWHSELPAGEQVIVGPLGLELGKAQPAVPAPAASQAALYFPTTGHAIADGFLTFYQQHDGPNLLGAPISEELAEGGATVQYFTKAELSWRSSSGVTLGDLGSLAARVRGWTAGSPPLAAVPAPPQALPPSTAAVASAVNSAAGLAGATGPAASASVQTAAVNAAAATGRIAVPVLAYHHIGDWPSVYTVSAENFSAQLAWLQANGYTGVTLRTLVDALFQRTALPTKPVVITIDDGYADAATTAREVLERFHMPATFFIPTWQTALSAATLRSLDAEGFDIEAHSRMHPDLTKLSDQAAWSEIAGSKADLERILGHPIELFAYPYGAVNTRISSMVARAGFRAGIGAYYGYSYTTAAALNEPRVLVDRGDDLTNFVAKVLDQRYKDTLNSPTNKPEPDLVQPSPPTPITSNTGASNSDPSSVGTSSGDSSGSSSSSAGDVGGSPDDTTTTSEPGGHGQIYE